MRAGSGILEVRAPRRVADKLTGTPDFSHIPELLEYNVNAGGQSIQSLSLPGIRLSENLWI